MAYTESKIDASSKGTVGVYIKENGGSSPENGKIMVSRNILFDEKGLKVENVGLIRQRLLKLVYNHDMRLPQILEKCSFKVLRDIVTKMFPSLKYVLIKYKDYDGDLVTITDTQVLSMTESCFDQLVQMEAEKEEKRLSLMRLHIVEINPEQEPRITEEQTEVHVSTTNLNEIPKEATTGADINMHDSKTKADAPGSEIEPPESNEKQMETETKVESKKKVNKTNVSVQEMVHGALPAEEAKTRKKEKDKNKQLKKMLEGKLLIGKQKEEQRKLEAMRWQFLA